MRLSLAAFVLLIVALATSCERGPHICGPSTCDGCCDQNGVCQIIAVPLCVSPGGTCRPECMVPVDLGPEDGGRDAGVVVLGPRLFTSAAELRGDLTLSAGIADPIAAADSLCQRIAEAEALSGTWLAFLTADGGHPARRFPGNGPWRVVRDNDISFADRAALEFSAPPFSIANDERGGFVSSPQAWTGLGLNPAADCAGWTQSADAGGAYGTPSSPASWYGGLTGSCALPRSLYCFEQAPHLPDGGLSPPLPTSATKRAFVTSLSFNGDLGGVDGGHQKCNDVAAAAGLGGGWRAWLGGKGRPAGSDFSFFGPWTRVKSDGGVAAASIETLRVGLLQQQISVDELGRSALSKRPWTAAFASLSPPNCSDWTSSTDAGHVGDSSSRGSQWHDYLPADCSTLHPLYCFEQ